MEFSSSLQLRSVPNPIIIKELKFSDYISLQKFLQNGVDTDIIQCLSSLISKYCTLPDNCVLSVVDKFILCLYLKSISVNSITELSISHTEIFKVDLLDLINKLLNCKGLYANSGLYTYSKPAYKGVYTGLPTEFQYKNTFDVADSCLHKFDFVAAPSNKRSEIFKKLPATFYADLTQYFNDAEERINTIIIPLPTKISPEPIVLSFKNGVFLELLKILLRSNLHEIYQKSYNLSAHANMSLSDINSISPVEVDVFYSLLMKENEEAEKRTSSIGKDSPGIPLI